MKNTLHLILIDFGSERSAKISAKTTVCRQAVIALACDDHVALTSF